MNPHHGPETPFQYRAYGLRFASAFPIPELEATDARGRGDLHARPDVTLCRGTIPAHLETTLTSSAAHEANPAEFLLRIEGVGRFLVSGGKRIVVEPDAGATDHEVRVFLLGTCLGALLHQRGFLVLHASGIGTPRGAVLFAGDSGAGKSTLLAEFLRRGHRMIVDDVCAVSLEAGRPPSVVPSYPRTRLWAASAARLDIDTSGLTRTRPDMDKFERQVPEQFWGHSASLIRIYHLAGTHRDELSLTRLNPTDAFRTVLANTYRQGLLDGLSLRAEHFQQAAEVAKLSRVVRAVRPENTFLLEELADLISEDAGLSG